MKSTIADVKSRAAVEANPYFAELERGAFEREDFVETQVQFFSAVAFFPRALAMVAARLPRPGLRLALLTNLADEHGGGDLARSHEATFLELLARLGVPAGEVARRARWPEARAFTTTLTGLCACDDVPTAIAALGIIEDLFSGISARLGRGIVANGWLAAPDLVHYRTHEALDVEHAGDLYRLVEPAWSSGPRERYRIAQGLELGAYAFLELYRGLWAARARRWTRDLDGPPDFAGGWWSDEPPV